MKTKILWLYRYEPRYNFDHFLHIDVAEHLAKDKNVSLMAYGHRMNEGCPSLSSVGWNEDITLNELHCFFNFDYVIVNTKSRCFLNYLPKNAIGNRNGEIREGEWLPKDFHTFNKTPKIMIEEDYHYEDGDSWYKERGFNLILHRHFVNVSFGNSFKSGIKHIFFPFSVDTSYFYDYNKKRKNNITYTGSINDSYYSDRKKAIERLSAYGLFHKTTKKHIENIEYVNNLNEYVSHLSGQSIYNILPAKIYEIASSGSILLTNNNPLSGLDLVFPKDCYVEYKNEGLDVVEKARFILREKQAVKEIADRAKKHILENHTHEIRNSQLLDLLKKEL